MTIDGLEFDLVNYLHIGFSKAASTSLQSFFKSREEIYFVYKTDFFNTLNSNVYQQGIFHYKSFFDKAKPGQILLESQEHIAMPIIHPELQCHATNLKALREMALRIKEHLPDIKLILVIRNQIDMLLSRYTQYILQGGKLSATDFLERLVFNKNYLKYADYRYSLIIKLLWEIFGKENILILLCEDLKADPDNFATRLLDFMKLGPSKFEYNMSKRKKNPAPSYWGVQTLRYLNVKLVKEKENLNFQVKTVLPYPIWYFVTKSLRIVDNLLIQNRRKQSLFIDQDHTIIKEIFLEDNHKLAKLLHKPISKLGYSG